MAKGAPSLELAPPPAASPARLREVPAVRRACAVLWLLGRHPDGLPLSQVARELDILPSTCLHILRELGTARLVAHDANAKLYRLGSGVLLLGRQFSQQSPFIQLAQPLLTQLSRDYGVGASAQERDGDDGMLVVAAASVLPGDMVSPGGRTHLFTGASGRLMAAHSALSEAQLRQRFDRLRWQDPPPYERWRKEVRAAASAGLAIDAGCFRKGITAIAAPIVNADGSVDHTISVTTISAQLDVARRKQLVAAVQAAAAQITQALS